MPHIGRSLSSLTIYLDISERHVIIHIDIKWPQQPIGPVEGVGKVLGRVCVVGIGSRKV